MSNKVLIIKSIYCDFEKWYFEKFRSISNVDVIEDERIMPGRGTIRKRVTAVWNILKMRKNLNGYSKIIVFNHSVLYLYLFLLVKNKRNCFLWLWNTVPQNKRFLRRLKLLKHIGFIYTFDENDAQKYGLRWNSQFLFNLENISDRDELDLFFVGADKGRSELLKKIQSVCEKEEINFEFHILSEPKEEDHMFFEKYMPYDMVLKNDRRSRAVLDLVKDKQSGMTVRVLEALFLDRKIVTNNLHLRDAPFYSKGNVFILGVDDISNLKAFLLGPKSGYDPKWKKYYCAVEWINRF